MAQIPRAQISSAIKSCKSRRKFAPEEDEKLRELIAQFGSNKWDRIAKEMKTRNARQCHDRWSTYLSPDIKKDAWTPEEDNLLIRLVSQNGNRWTQMTKYFPKRTDANLKNRWNVLKRKQGYVSSLSCCQQVYSQIDQAKKAGLISYPQYAIGQPQCIQVTRVPTQIMKVPQIFPAAFSDRDANIFEKAIFEHHGDRLPLSLFFDDTNVGDLDSMLSQF